MTIHLAIDIGASGGRHIAGWVDSGRIVTQEVYRFENGAEMKSGHLAWDIEALFSHVVAGLAAAKMLGLTPASVGIDTWGVDFVLLDKDDNLVGNAIAYRDSRTEGVDALLEKTLPFDRHYRLCGTAKQPFNTVYQMIAALREHPEYRDTVRDFLMIPEYLSYRLTGKKAHEWTNLSTASLMDVRERTWSAEVRRAADLPDHWFETPIAAPGTSLGGLLPEIAECIGYDTQVILPATHDTGSAYMAVPARDDGAAFLSSGTWSLLGVELPEPIPTDESRIAGFTNEGGYGYNTRYLKNIMGLWMLQCIRRETGKKHSYADMAQMADESHYPAWIDAGDNRFLAPHSMLDEVKAALAEQGAPEPETLGDIIRAVTVGLAVCYKKAIAEMEDLTGRKFTSLNIVGGGSQNVTLNRLTALHTGLPVLAGPAEGTALGNLAAQMIACGTFASLEDFRRALRESCDLTEYEGGNRA